MYEITYCQGNNYRCGCCRHVYEYTEDCANKKEVIEFLSKLEAHRIMRSSFKYETDEEGYGIDDANDVYIDEIVYVKYTDDGAEIRQKVSGFKPRLDLVLKRLRKRHEVTIERTFGQDEKEKELLEKLLTKHGNV